MPMRHFPFGRASGSSPLLLLVIAAVSFSRAVLALFADPGGPNLIVVLGLGIVILSVSLIICFSRVLPAVTGLKRSIGVLPIQFVVATAAYLLLR